jgi:tripeptide aminopeptidase
MKSIETRFCEYVQIDTQSDPNSLSQPSTEKQKDLSRVLVGELLAMGLKDAHLDEFGYVYATLPSNVDRAVPVLCFCAHVDTSPDCTGAGVKPLVHRNYQGQDLILPDDTSQVITTKDHPYLLERIGDDIVTASGTTLLGADDKAGVAVIMDFVQHMVNHPELPHGDIRILFTPDEEIGRGVDKVDMEKLGAVVGYTLDAGERGCYEDENFSADGAKVHFYGVSAHPGYAKDKLVNALKIAGEFLAALPKGEWSPETTEDTQGFVHPVAMGGVAEHAWVLFIVRDFKTPKLSGVAHDVPA